MSNLQYEVTKIKITALDFIQHLRGEVESLQLEDQDFDIREGGFEKVIQVSDKPDISLHIEARLTQYVNKEIDPANLIEMPRRGTIEVTCWYEGSEIDASIETDVNGHFTTLDLNQIENTIL